MNWPPQARDMEYNFETKPSYRKRRTEDILHEIGHNPYRPTQPNGFSDLESDWISPELLIRRLAIPQEFSMYMKKQLNVEGIIKNNCSFPDEPLKHMSNMKTQLHKLQNLFPSYWMLKA
jgi:uncharacterized protein (DUF1800 family)